MKNIWKNDKIQFARLLCEITNNPSFKKKERNALAKNLCLFDNEMDELIQRAQNVWEDSKKKYSPPLI